MVSSGRRKLVSLVTLDIYLVAGFVLVVAWWIPAAWPWAQIGALAVMFSAICAQVLWGEW